MTNALHNPAESEQKLAAQQPADAHTKKQTIADGFHNRTRGEKLFNRLTYTGVGYFGVTGFSVFLTWLLRDSPKTSLKFQGFVEKMMEKYPKYAKTIESNATIATLFIGGSVVSVLPIKWLEDNKAAIVKRFDRKYYGDDMVNNDPDLIAAHKEMDALPKQTWISVAGSRIVAFAATLGTSLLMGSNDSPIARKTGESIDRRSVEFGRWFDGKLNSAAKPLIEATKAENKVLGGGTRVLRNKDAVHPDRIGSRVFSYIALDGFYTIITSVTLFAFTRILAPVLGKKNKNTAEVETPHRQTPFPVPHKDATPEIEAEPQKRELPQPHVSQTTHQLRLAEPPAQQELTA